AGLEIQGVDILVLLGRVLCVLDGSVGAMTKPLRVFVDPGMVRRTLPREIQGNLEAEPLGLLPEPEEVVLGSEARLDGQMAALFGSNRPGTARIVRARSEAVVRPLAEAAADRVNRRQVDDVESQIRDGREQGRSVGKCAAAIGVRSRRSG